MGAFLDEFRRRSGAFLTNWWDSDLPYPRRFAVFTRNRVKALRTGCCGDIGAPGC